MSEPAWKSLVETLRDENFKSPYLDRLSERLTALQSKILNRGSLEQEILSEMAYALVCAEDKLNLALLRCDQLRSEYDASTSPSLKMKQAYNASVKDARSVRRDFMIHREAIGLRDAAVVREYFPIPAKK